MKRLFLKIRKSLKENADPKVRESTKRFFKEKINPYGLKSSTVNQMINKIIKEDLKGKRKEEVFSLCELLYKGGYMEENFIASSLAYSKREDFEECDFKILEGWVKKYVSNWAQCDVLCNHTVAAFLESYPKYTKKLKAWSKSQNRWVRRASAVSFVLLARKGLFTKEIFEIAEMLLEDGDDMVQKGYGWMLKAYADYDQRKVFDFVMKHKRKMPRTALRYAIEKFPKVLKKKAMVK